MKFPGGAGVLGLVILCSACASTTPRRIAAAWLEANGRAGIPSPSLPPPEIDWMAPFEDCSRPAAGPRQAARYLPDLDRVEILSSCLTPIHSLLVHEFLHAIHERTLMTAGEAFRGCLPEGESWVRRRSQEREAAALLETAPCSAPASAFRTAAAPIRPSTSPR